MPRKRFVLPLAVLLAGGSAAIVGVLHADAAEPPVSAGSFVTSPAVSPAVTPKPSAPVPASPSAPPTRGAENCTAGGSVAAGKYWLHNNQWGKKSGSGSQCVWSTGSGGWGTRWEWTGAGNTVKSYVSSVLGWHWGWKSPGTGLPVRLGEHRAVRTAWDYAVDRKTANTMNVSYDLWLHDRADPDWQDEPTDEVMVWLYRFGGAVPVGTKQATVTVGGTEWDVYRGDAGWRVSSFVRTSNTSSVELDLTDFTDYLIDRGWLERTRYLSSVEAGAEIFTGSGALDTSAYTVTIG